MSATKMRAIPIPVAAPKLFPIMFSTPEIKVVATPDAVAEEAAHRIVAAAKLAIAAKGSFSIALSGGSTPKTLHQKLAAEPLRSQIEWPKVEIFFGDERCVPPDHGDSNYRMARETLLSQVPIPGDNIYRMHGEDDPQAAAKAYDQMLKEKFEDGGLDLILLGMGEDGHTASLFPNTTALKDTEHLCVANHVEKLNTWRITMTAPFINKAANVVILVAGDGKTSRLERVLQGEIVPDLQPVQMIAPEFGQLTWILDAAAAGMKS